MAAILHIGHATLATSLNGLSVMLFDKTITYLWQSKYITLIYRQRCLKVAAVLKVVTLFIIGFSYLLFNCEIQLLYVFCFNLWTLGVQAAMHDVQGI